MSKHSLQKYEFEFENHNISMKTAFLSFSGFQDFDARVEIDGCAIESSSKKPKISIKNLMVQIKYVAKEKHDFENGDEPVTNAPLRNFGLSGFYCK